MNPSALRWRLRGPYCDLDLLHRIDVRPDESASEEMAEVVISAIDGWLKNHWARQTLVEIYEAVSGMTAWDGRGVAEGALDRSIKLQIERALKSGRIVALRRREPQSFPVVTAAQSAPVGHSSAEESRRASIEIVLFDIAGAVMAGQLCKVVTPDGDPRSKEIDATGLRIDDLDAGVCTVTFPKIDKRPAGVVPPTADLRERGHATRLTRADKDKRFDLATHQERYVFQLQRRQAYVIELEHFDAGGAVMLPGSSPAPMRDNAAPVNGVDALKACLARAKYCPVEQMLITGHDSKLSKERAKSVLYLLTADRALWVALSVSTGREMDCRFILAWIRQTTGWACEPGDQMAPAVSEFQKRFNAETGASIAVDGIIGPQVWGAFFDMYMRAIRPPPAKTEHARPYIRVVYGKNFVPHIVARDATGDDARYVEMNPYNPTKPIPGNAGWHDTWPGETVTLPDDWDGYVEKLREAGWDAHHGDKRAISPDGVGPASLAAPGPTAVGCGAAHLDTPHREMKDRRGKQRHVEVLFFDEQSPPKVRCEGSGPCSSANCELYDPREYEFGYVPPDTSPSIRGYDFDLPPQKRTLLAQERAAPPPSPAHPALTIGFIIGAPRGGDTTPPTAPGGDFIAFRDVSTTGAKKPEIHHDHGFLDDGHGNIDESKRRSPTAGDYLKQAAWEAKVMGASILRPDLKEACAAYRHFLFHQGAAREFEYERFVTIDRAGSRSWSSAIEDTCSAAIEIYDKRGSNAEDDIIIQTDAFGAGSKNPRYPYPGTENWQKTIGAYFAWIAARIRVATQSDGRRQFRFGMILYAEDMYNFNPGNKDIATGIPDSDNGIFEITGLGHEFLHSSKMSRQVSFSVRETSLRNYRLVPRDLEVTLF